MHAISRTIALLRRHLKVCILGLCALMLVVQLTAAASHEHDPADDLADCVLCHMGSKLSATMPAVAPQLLAVWLVIAYLVARRPDYVSIVPLRYLTPSRQAPPAHLPL